MAMKNGDLDSKGPLASIIQSEGTIESFKVCILLLTGIISFFQTYLYIIWKITEIHPFFFLEGGEGSECGFMNDFPSD